MLKTETDLTRRRKKTKKLKTKFTCVCFEFARLDKKGDESLWSGAQVSK